MKNLHLIPAYCREGKTYAAIGRLCGIAPGTVSVAIAALRANGVEVPDTLRVRAAARRREPRRKWSTESSAL